MKRKRFSAPVLNKRLFTFTQALSLFLLHDLQFNQPCDGFGVGLASGPRPEVSCNKRQGSHSFVTGVLAVYPVRPNAKYSVLIYRPTVLYGSTPRNVFWAIVLKLLCRQLLEPHWLDECAADSML
jgi:hypothetical protein